MRPGRRLALRREILHELEAHDLARVAGGATHIDTCYTCHTHEITCYGCLPPSLGPEACDLTVRDLIRTTGNLVLSCGPCLS